ncbi:hypothetical protein [Nocardia salmonicida]|uniref:hypothetical protein n=1 Tax=Nocardia salmonicida TaxID=53431 RepID=UPI0034072BBB
MNVGDQVRIGVNGVSLFRVVEIEDSRARILSVLDVPGAYEFPVRLVDLVPAPDDAVAPSN